MQNNLRTRPKMILTRSYVKFCCFLKTWHRLLLYLIFIFPKWTVPVNSVILEKCDIALKLEDSKINENLADRWICLAEALSNLNTSSVKKYSPVETANQSLNNCQLYNLGLFQIPNGWCNTPDDNEFGICAQNGCNIDCNKLLDDDITDDINCIKLIHDFRGFNIWSQIMVNDCRRGITKDTGWNITECLSNGRRRRRRLTTVPLWGALLIVAISCCTVFLLTYFFYRHRRNNLTILSQSEIKQFKYDEPYNTDYEIDPAQFSIDFSKCLGKGAYGIVYKGLRRGNVVAVKTVKQNPTKEYLQSLLGEIKILTHIGKHDFTVNLEGACTTKLSKGILYVFMEFCPLGSLEKFLRSNRANFVPLEDTKRISGESNAEYNFEAPTNNSRGAAFTLTFKHLLQYAHQVASGMEFLASKKVVHGDLAARNILLVDQNFAKISDFGLSRKLYDYINYIKKKEEPLPWRWMSIESLRENKFSTSSDVWMYGVLLFEVFSLGEVPYPGLSWTQDFLGKLEAGFRLLKPKHAPNDVYNNIMAKCWDNNPTQRPSFSDLSHYFRQALHQITAMDYTELVENKNVHQTLVDQSQSRGSVVKLK